MRAISNAAALILLTAAMQAQVLTVYELKDPAARRLQSVYRQHLEKIASEIQAHEFPYKFYFSRVLDIDEAQQLRAEQRSIRFDKYNSQTVLEITGNYYAAYSDKLMDKRARTKKTYEDVVLPILKIVEPKFPPDDAFAGFAIEVSHHVRRRVMSVQTENAENLVFVFSREAAHRVVTATNEEQKQAALLDTEIYVDAEPFLLWLTGEPPAGGVPKALARKKTEVAGLTAPPAAEPRAMPEPTVSPSLLKGTTVPDRLITPDTLAHLKAAHQETIGRMRANLDAQAHFVPYAPPTFVAFHRGAYLELSVTSALPSNNGSRYQLAALAFDEHIAHLVRPVLAYFPQDAGFDGIAFSTTLKLPGGNNSEAVEFFLPFSALRCFANYDCTGQQLIDSGIVLINGERSALSLTTAEAVASR